MTEKGTKYRPFFVMISSFSHSMVHSHQGCWPALAIIDSDVQQAGIV